MIAVTLTTSVPGDPFQTTSATLKAVEASYETRKGQTRFLTIARSEAYLYSQFTQCQLRRKLARYCHTIAMPKYFCTGKRLFLSAFLKRDTVNNFVQYDLDQFERRLAVDVLKVEMARPRGGGIGIPG